MKFKNTSLVFLAVIVVFTAIIVSSDSYILQSDAASLAENKDSVRTLESDLKSIQGSLADIQRSIKQAKQNQADQLAIKNQLDQEVSLAEREIEILEKLISGYNDSITEKENGISLKDEEIEETVQMIGDRLVMQHENGNSNVISYVLGSSDFADLLTRIEIANALFEYDRTLIEQLTSDRISLAILKDELTTTRDKCNEAIAELETKRVDLQAKIDTATSYLATYKRDEATYQRQYNEKAAEMESIEKEIKELLAQIELQERTNYSNEEFRFPLPYDATYWNSGGFGWRVWNNGRATDYHKGVDFAAYRGTPILATNSGTVILTRNSPSYGLYLIIDHGGGVTSLYAHCSKLLVNTGDVVLRGDKVAEVGSTGDSTGNHLHFSILENGVHVDPMKYISEP
ncbi:MAG: peptidoglycan DD-metalloendopeptidase family protein [Clostridia bacterium]|nr:peptidoglycan DD-metalloendopeptidase family protein [Clostridia bacterium]